MELTPVPSIAEQSVRFAGMKVSGGFDREPQRTYVIVANGNTNSLDGCTAINHSALLARTVVTRVALGLLKLKVEQGTDSLPNPVSLNFGGAEIKIGEGPTFFTIGIVSLDLGKISSAIKAVPVITSLALNDELMKKIDPPEIILEP